MTKVVRRIVIGLIVLFVVAGIAVAAASVWLLSGFGVTTGSPQADTREDGVYLIMVRDTRDGGNTDLLGQTQSLSGDVGRTDAMVLARMSKNGTIDLVSIPRDTLVSIPACQRSNGTTSTPEETKINAAYALGAAADDTTTASEFGIRCAEETVRNFTGVPLAGAIVMDSKAIEETVNGLGGVNICVSPERAASLPGFQPGCQELNGEQAFAYSQARHGIDDQSDIARIQRQQQLLKAVAQKLSQKKVPWDIPELMNLVHNLGTHVTATDGVLSLSNGTQLVSSVRGSKIVTVTGSSRFRVR